MTTDINQIAKTQPTRLHWVCAVQIARSEGVPGLYRGLAPSLAMAVPSTVLYYSLYDSLRETFHALGAGPLLAPLVSGSCSRIAAATATAPLELIRTRMQVDEEKRRRYRDAASRLRPYKHTCM